MIHLREQWWAYPLPVTAEGAEIRGEHPGRPYQLLSFYGEADAVDLPPGTWQIVCTSKEVTEEHAHSLVDSSTWHFPIKHTRYIDYAYPFDREFKQRWSEGFGTAKESLASLLTSKGSHLNKNWLILKKQ
jgi:hypothetical protein